MPAAAQLLPYHVEGDGIPAPLTGHTGDPGRGASIVAAREVSTCVLCHAGPFADPRASGTVGPNLTGVGARLTDAQIRLRVIDQSRIDPETVMPAFYRTEGLVRVGQRWVGRPVLSANQIEDVVAYLDTLKSP